MVDVVLMNQLVRAPCRPVRVHPRGAAGFCLESKFRSSLIPVIYLTRQAISDGGTGPVDPVCDMQSHGCEVLRNRDLDGVIPGDVVEVASEPTFGQHACEQLTFSVSRRPVVEVRRVPNASRRPIGIDLDEFESTRHDGMGSVTVTTGVGDRVFKHDEYPWRFAGIAIVHQHRSSAAA